MATQPCGAVDETEVDETEEEGRLLIGLLRTLLLTSPRRDE